MFVGVGGGVIYEVLLYIPRRSPRQHGDHLDKDRCSTSVVKANTQYTQLKYSHVGVLSSHWTGQTRADNITTSHWKHKSLNRTNIARCQTRYHLPLRAFSRHVRVVSGNRHSAKCKSATSSRDRRATHTCQFLLEFEMSFKLC